MNICKMPGLVMHLNPSSLYAPKISAENFLFLEIYFATLVLLNFNFIIMPMLDYPLHEKVE